MKANYKENQMNKLSGRYEIIEQIGIGGMSYVYKAYDTIKKRLVAIKILKDELAIDDEFVSKFKSEALSCRGIDHENVVAAYDVVDEDNRHYIVMEYVDGETLNKYIKKKGRLSNEETISISLQVARGIEAAHKKGIIHRDIKPQNIVVDEKGVAKITDFGIARAITSTTRNISVIGTVHYISPEQVRNTTVDYRSDIYSFGCTMYEMITGIVPFAGETPLEIIISHLRENIKNPRLNNPDIYTSIEKIILKSTRMIPRERYQNMGEMIKDLELAIKNKDGDYIKDTYYDDDEEGKTVIISEEDMKVIKAVSQKFSSKNSYNKSNEVLTKEQKEFIDKYIQNGSFKHHTFMKRIIILAALVIAILGVIMAIITIDTRKHNVSVATGSVVVNSFMTNLDGIDFNLANELAKEYGIIINNVGNEYSDTVGYGKIIRVVDDNSKTSGNIDVIVSLGSEDIDFTNTAWLNTIKWTDMKYVLDGRGIEYSTTEINDINVPRGYIIGANKANTKDPGELVFTISRGISDSIKTMPDLTKLPINDAAQVLEDNELVLGKISYLRDYTIPENCVISQSVKLGSEVKAGTSIDLILSCGADGVEYIADTTEKWHADLSSTYRVSKNSFPNITDSNETVILQVRLKQNTNEGVVYTELIEPQEYKIDTIIPLVFTNIEGAANVQNGQVEVVDVVNDKVVGTIDVIFWP